jgi:hypothetical protein
MKASARGTLPVSKLDLDNDALELLRRIARRRGETVAESLAVAISWGLDGEALERRWTKEAHWRTRMAVVAQPLGGTIYEVRILPAAAGLAERWRRRVEDDTWPCTAASALCGLLEEGLCDLERMTLGSRQWSWEIPPATDADEPPDPGKVVQMKAARS